MRDYKITLKRVDTVWHLKVVTLIDGKPVYPKCLYRTKSITEAMNLLASWNSHKMYCNSQQTLKL